MKVSIVLITWIPSEIQTLSERRLKKHRMVWLKETFRSLKNSVTMPYELIVVDNGSEEQTKYLKTQQIDKHIINEKNVGIGHARNQGMEAAIGDYIVFLDNDIFLEKGWLEESIEALETYPNEKLIGCPAFGNDLLGCKKRLYLGKLGKYPLYQRYGGACWVARRKMLDEFGKWSTSTTPGRDYCVKVTRAGYKFIGLEKHKATHLGKSKSFDFHKKFVDGKWVKAGGIDERT